MKVAFIVIFVFLSSVHIDQIRAGKLITYYDNAEFVGESYTLNLADGSCSNLSYFDKRISSISTNGICLQIFEGSIYRRDFHTVQPRIGAHNNLSTVGFNDRSSSLRKC